MERYKIVLAMTIPIDRKSFPKGLTNEEVINNELLATGPYFLINAEDLEILEAKPVGKTNSK